MKKNNLIVFIVLIFTLFISGCKKSEIKVGICFPELVVERWRMDKDNLIDKLKKAGADVKFSNANKDPMRQYKQAVRMLQGGIDVLILAPVDEEKSGSIVKEAHKRGVKVIAYDRIVSDVDLDYYIGHDVISIGEKIGKFALKNTPKGNYVFINGGIRDNNAHIIRAGFYSVLEPNIKSKDITVQFENYSMNWSEVEGFEMMEDCIKLKIPMDFVIASNDELASGVIRSLKKHNIKNVSVTGQDADLDACRRIVKGEQVMTVYKSIEKLSDAVVSLALSVASKQSIKLENTVNNGFKLVPAIIVNDIHTVTKENMKEVVVKNRYHKESDIYDNIK